MGVTWGGQFPSFFLPSCTLPPPPPQKWTPRDPIIIIIIWVGGDFPPPPPALIPFPLIPPPHTHKKPPAHFFPSPFLYCPGSSPEVTGGGWDGMGTGPQKKDWGGWGNTPKNDVSPPQVTSSRGQSAIFEGGGQPGQCAIFEGGGGGLMGMGGWGGVVTPLGMTSEPRGDVTALVVTSQPWCRRHSQS